jgi:hypothetical protein
VEPTVGLKFKIALLYRGVGRDHLEGWLMKSVVWLWIASLALAPILLSGCEEKTSIAIVVASTPVGGVVRFSGSTIGGVIIQAQEYCARRNRNYSAVPIGFYRLPDERGLNQLMTFECKRNPAGE